MAERDISCDECQSILSNPKCWECMPYELLPQNAIAFNIYAMIAEFGQPITFEAVHRAIELLGVVDDRIFGKVAAINAETEAVRTSRRKEKSGKNSGPKRR